MKENSIFPIERNRYFYGKLLTVRDFEQEQTYFNAKRMLHNRTVHGAGVVCGLGVSGIDDATLMVESGLALDYLGREIVIEEPIIRKLEMIAGQDVLKNRDDAYLCLAYDEQDTEPVNAVGGDAEAAQQHNMIKEGYKLFFSAETPEYKGILEAAGKENVNILYSSAELTLVLHAPGTVVAGDEFNVGVLVIKNYKTPPVHFTISGANRFVESEGGQILFTYDESAQETRNVVEKTFRLRSQSLSEVAEYLFPDGAELNITMGDHSYKNFIAVEAPVYLSGSRAQYDEFTRKKDSLAKHMQGREIPIYLAKVELIGSTDRAFLGGITNLPFAQRIAQEASFSGGGADNLEVTAKAHSLEFWQKPEVNAVYNQGENAIHLDFGIPTPETYDYVTSHGAVDITMSGGIKVNARYFSEEIPHGLGPGNVDVRLSVEFGDNEELGQMFGNSEVFRSKNAKVTPPWVEVAAVVYPKRGTMRIGLWLHDQVEGNMVRVHYFAQKPERDTKRLLEKSKVTVSILPEVGRMGPREEMRFKAAVRGSEDKNVTWQVVEDNGGTVDANGIYHAPEVPGTYELVARATADENASASAFIIVE